MNARWFAALLSVPVLMLFGCGPGAKVAGPCSSGFSVQFRIASVKDSLPLDSLFVNIAVGGGSPQPFSVNLKTGVSSAAISAAQGQSYDLNFKLYSSGVEIGSGTSHGSLECDLDVALEPQWDAVATAKVKKDLDLGVLIPAKLEVNFAQAVAGRDFELPLDSLRGSAYRWYLKLGESTLIENEGPVVRIPIADSLAGKTLVLRLQVVSKSIIKEDRTWIITVLSAVPKDLVARIKSRSDTASPQGISLAFRYDKNLLLAVENYATLVPAVDEKAVGVESLFYDDKGRLSRTSTWTPDSARTDSLFGYDADGRLAILDVRKGGGKVVDSLFYQGGRISAARRYANGALSESSRYKWTAADKREDSLFTMGSQGLVWSRLIQNVFKNDSLVSRRVLAVRDGLQPLGVEIIAYNALGGRAYREVYSEEASLTLELSDTYAYDAKGRLVSMRHKDEMTGVLLYALDYEYAPAGGKVASPLAKSGSSGGVSVLAVLDDLRFAHSDWDFRRAQRLSPSGR